MWIWRFNEEGLTKPVPVLVLKTRRSLRAVQYHPQGGPLILTAEVRRPEYPPPGLSGPISYSIPQPNQHYANVGSINMWQVRAMCGCISPACSSVPKSCMQLRWLLKRGIFPKHANNGSVYELPSSSGQQTWWLDEGRGGCRLREPWDCFRSEPGFRLHACCASHSDSGVGDCR